MKKKDNHITPRGFEKLSTEHDNLLLKERPEILKVIQWAAGNGDRSENADYIYGRKRLREIDKRLRFLQKRLEIANIIDPAQVESDKILFGATVKIMTEEGEHKTYHIVGTDESEPQKNKISWVSPIAKALMGKEVGDMVEIKTPGRNYEAEIESIDYINIPE